MENPNFKNLAKEAIDREEEVQDINNHIQTLQQEKIWLENEIKDLENQEIHDDNATSLEVEIQNKKRELANTNNELNDFLRKKEKFNVDISEIELN